MRSGNEPLRTKPTALLAAALIGSLALTPASGQETGAKLKQGARDFAKSQIEKTLRAMNRPFEPFRLIVNIAYVGASDISSFLITTPEGHILLDTGFASTVPMIRDNVRRLGYRFEDIKILLNSHAHLDHAGGHALMKNLTGAQIVMSEADAALLARGGRGDFPPLGDDVLAYQSAKADRIVRDGDQVSLGGVTLTAHLTPGHTKGCTTWTMVVEEGGNRYDVVFFGSTTILPGVRLVNNAQYPGIAEDLARSFRALESLHCDVFLAPHGSMFGLRDKARRLASGVKPNPFIDPAGYRAYLARSKEGYLRQLERERRGTSNSRNPDAEGVSRSEGLLEPFHAEASARSGGLLVRF
jgi:metallo-beta-lactamase class B